MDQQEEESEPPKEEPDLPVIEPIPEPEVEIVKLPPVEEEKTSNGTIITIVLVVGVLLLFLGYAFKKRRKIKQSIMSGQTNAINKKMRDEEKLIKPLDIERDGP